MRRPFASLLWRNEAFVRVWGAATISIFGSLITGMALPLAAILVLGAGAIEVSILRSVELGTALVVGLVAGAWVDRLRRRPVLIWSDLGRVALLGSIPLAFVLGVVLDELSIGPALIGVIAGVGGFASFLGAIVATRAARRWGWSAIRPSRSMT